MKNFLKWLSDLFKTAPKPEAPVVVPPTVDQSSSKVKPSLKDPKWYTLALKYLGKNEQDKEFDKFLAGFWKIVGLSGYKTIAGSKYAWCGLFVAVMLHLSGYQHAKNGAGAKNWSAFGTKIDYVKKGIPHGSIVRINHGLDCSSSKGNHVAFACGDYKPSDFIVDGKLKPGATVTLLGGNQGNQVKYSKYDMREVCSVSWPSEENQPEVTKTIPCDTSAKSGDDTR
jgi:hypothetical protein